MEGALALTAEHEYAALSDAAKLAFGRLFGALVNLADVQQEERPVRRSAATAELSLDPGMAEFIGEYTRARLFVLDRDANGEQSVSVVHEALFSYWNRLKNWIADNCELLRVRGRVEEAATLWNRENRPRDMLLVGGRALSRAQALLARDGEIALTLTLREFVAQSASNFRTRQRLRRVAAAVLVAALSIAGVVTYYEREAAQRHQIEAKLIEYQQAMRDAEAAFLGRAAKSFFAAPSADILRDALQKTLQVFPLRGEVTRMSGRPPPPPESAASDTVRLLEFAGFLRAELGDTYGSLRDFRERDELVKNGMTAQANGPMENDTLRQVMEIQIDLLIANDELKARCERDPVAAAKALDELFGVKSACANSGKSSPEESAKWDLEITKRFAPIFDYLTRAHPAEKDFDYLLQLLAKQGHDYEVLGDWNEAQRAWSERVDVARRKLDWGQKNDAYRYLLGASATKKIATEIGGPLFKAWRDLAEYHLRRKDHFAALEDAKQALKIMGFVLDNGGTVSETEQFGIRKLMALALFATGQSDESRATLEPGAEALSKWALSSFVDDWDKLQGTYAEIAQTRRQLQDEAGTLKAYGDLAWLLEREVGTFRRNGLPDKLAETYVPLSWFQILARQFTLAITTARRGLALENTTGKNLGLKINLAHALLLNDEVPEAAALYEEFKLEVFSQPALGPPRLVAQEVLDDFDELAKHGITHPAMAAIRASMKRAVENARKY